MLCRCGEGVDIHGVITPTSAFRSTLVTSHEAAKLAPRFQLCMNFYSSSTFFI